MPETWKGKTRGGTFGYMFFIYMIRCLGITAAYGFLSLVVLYFIPFAPKATASTWQYARNRLKYGRAKELSGIFERTEWKHRRNYDRRPCR